MSSATSPELPLSDIQGIILRGYGHHFAACFLLLEVTEPALARAWLATLRPTDAETAGLKADAPGSFVNVALSYRGLQKLGLDSVCLEGFPRDFAESSDVDVRARILGDVDESAAEHWLWGGRAMPVHAVLMLYSRTDTELAPFRQEHEAALERHGFRVIRVLDTLRLADRKEHFGFRDGIAQPVVAGCREEEPPHNTLKAGEFFLGYEDGYGKVAYAPTTRSGFAFGRSGSYMVLRQLGQNVRAFWRFCGDRAAALGIEPATLAAKMVGRWPSGASLVEHDSDPKSPAFEDEDRFGYASKDALGERCPFGSHVRRSNPRDWDSSGKPEQAMELANLHRMIRRGRAYGAPVASDMNIESLLAGLDRPESPETDRGLHFVCFVGNIERQFEFVQQHWCNNPKFAGLYDGADPIMGWHRGPPSGLEQATFTLQGKPARRRACGLDRFVRVRGSGYFFMPSISALKYLAENGA